MRRDDKRWLAWALGALVVAAAAPVVVLQALGMLESADDKRTAALLALVGVTVTACASVIGTLVSRQSERRLAHEHEDEQSRLRLDAAMKAGALFNANGDASPDPAAVASGLLALTQLDREDLAVALLVDLWDRKPDAASAQDVRVRSVSHETAILVLDAALSSTNANAQPVAAEPARSARGDSGVGDRAA